MTTEPWWLPDAPREFSVHISAIGIPQLIQSRAQNDPDAFCYLLYKKFRERLRDRLHEQYGKRRINGVEAWRVYVPEPSTIALGLRTGIVSAQLIVDPRLTESHCESVA